MRIIASLVVYNEADRYLESCLKWNSSWWDELFVFDDQSTDDTVAVCATYTDTVVRRPDHVSSFLDHEGEFRGTAWKTMEQMCGLEDGDWVFCFDADEFVVGGEHLRDIAEAARAQGYNSVDIQIPEIWKLDPLMRRMDGYWGDDMFRPEFIRW